MRRWSGELRGEMIKLGFRVSVLHTSIYSMPENDTHIVVHVDDFLCVGPWDDSEALYKSLKNVYDRARWSYGRYMRST